MRGAGRMLVFVATGLALLGLEAPSAWAQLADILGECGVEPLDALPFSPGTEPPGEPVPAFRRTEHPSFPARIAVDDEGTIPAPSGMSVVASAPVRRDDGSTPGWFALLVEGQPASAEDSPSRMSFYWFPRGEEPVPLFSHEVAPDAWVAREATFVRVEGDRLASGCLASAESEGTVWAVGRCLTFADYLSESPLGTALEGLPWPALDHEVDRPALTFRDVDGDGVPELLRGNVLVLPDAEAPSGVAAAPLDEQPIWLEIRYGMTHPPLGREPFEHVRDLWRQTDDLRGMLRGTADWSGAGSCVRERLRLRGLELAVAERGRLAGWRRFEARFSTRDEDSQHALLAPVPADLLDWPRPPRLYGRRSEVRDSLLRWRDDEHVVVETPVESVVCGSDGCTELDEGEGDRDGLTVSPSGLRFHCLASFLGGFTTFIASAQRREGEVCDCDFPMSPVSSVIELGNEVSIGPWGSGATMVGVTVRGLPSDGPVSDQTADNSLCGYAASAVHVAQGWVGWLSESALLYAADSRFYSVSLADPGTETSRIEPTEVPERLRPVAGMTADRHYRYFVQPGDPAFVWRADLQTGEIRSVDVRQNDLLERYADDDFSRRPRLDPRSSTGTYVVPSPDGTRLAVVVDHELVGVWQLAQDETSEE